MEGSSNGAENTMSKIKIVSKEKEFEGTVEEKVATQFGCSAHISVSKKHSGKVIPIIIPAHPEYAWILSEKDLKQVIDACKDVLQSQTETKLTFFKNETIKNIQEKRFSLDELIKIIGILEQKYQYQKLAKKIKLVYGL